MVLKYPFTIYLKLLLFLDHYILLHDWVIISRKSLLELVFRYFVNINCYVVVNVFSLISTLISLAASDNSDTMLYTCLL